MNPRYRKIFATFNPTSVPVCSYTKGVDMWSIGCILGEMLLGKPLFPGTSTMNQIEQILRVIPAPSPEGRSLLQGKVSKERVKGGRNQSGWLREEGISHSF